MRVSPVPLLVALLFGIIPLFGYAAYAHADTSCPNAGERAATEADIPLMKSAGYPAEYAVVGHCWNPGNKYAGADDGQAKQYLKTILCPADGDNYGGMGPDQTIEKLDGQFSVCAAKFLKAARDKGINVCIREGVRTPAKQEQYVRSGVIACKKGAMCEHPRGVAIDVNVRPSVNNCASYRSLHDSAQSFGVIFYLGCRDAYHFVPLKGANCNSGGIIQPDTYYDYPQYYAPTTQPYYGPPPGFSTPFSATPAPSPLPTNPTQQTQSQAQNQTTNQPQICDPKFSCTGSVTYYQTSSCTSQVYQVCQYGCASSGTSCATSTSTSATSTRNSTGTSIDIGTSTDNSNTNTNDNLNGSGPSVSDLLNNMVNAVSFTSADIGTSTSLAFRLNPDTGDVETLDSSSQGSSTAVAAGTITSVQPITGQQTFTSGDLGNTYDGQYGSQQTSTFQSVLNGLQSALLWALNVLKGFGGNAPAPQFAP